MGVKVIGIGLGLGCGALILEVNESKGCFFFGKCPLRLGCPEVPLFLGGLASAGPLFMITSLLLVIPHLRCGVVRF